MKKNVSSVPAPVVPRSSGEDTGRRFRPAPTNLNRELWNSRQLYVPCSAYNPSGASPPPPLQSSLPARVKAGEVASCRLHAH